MPEEFERAAFLKKSLSRKNISAEDFLQDHYPAIAIHSNSTIFACNQVLADYTGYSMDELEGMNAWKLFPPESATVLMENLQCQSEQPYQVKARHKDGSLFEIELKATNFELSGEPVRAVLVRRV
ncbi:MAG: PAS domain S-box protein [Thioalkalispiraceae bacterium]|jgi:PAS domain S-box-containing protein